MPGEPKRGEVWTVDFDPGRGAEIRKTRPAVVMNVNVVGKLPLRVIVPITGWQGHFENVPWLVRIEAEIGNGLPKTSAGDAFQLRSFSIERFVDKIGILQQQQMEAIVRGIGEVVGTPAAFD